MKSFEKDLVETMLPRCSDKCEPLKTCKHACTEIQNTCLGNGLKGQLEMAMGMGSIVDSFLGNSAGLIKGWVKKLTTCAGDSISSSTSKCLSPGYNAPLCDPTVTSDPVTTNAPTTNRPEDDDTTTNRPEDDDTTTKRPEDDDTTTKRPEDDDTTTKRPEDDDTTTKRPQDGENDSRECKEINCKFSGCTNEKYYGTINEGTSEKNVEDAVKKFTSLIDMAGPML